MSSSSFDPAAPIAALPMYDWPEIRPALDAFWAGWRDAIRARGLDAPEALDRSDEIVAQWRDPRLLVGQTCGRPFATGLRGVARLIATPVYAAEGCEGPLYASWIVARADAPERSLSELAAPRIAVNGYDSHSGWGALLRVAPQLDLDLSNTVVSGAHRASARAVADGGADLAAIDAVSLRLLERCEPETARKLRRIARTIPAPGTPFVAAASRSDAEIALLRAALEEALASPDLAAARAEIGLAGAVALAEGDYEPMAADADP